MELSKVKQFLGDIDIYLLDQIFKGRYQKNAKIFDAGCGEGRNMKWFYHNNFNCFGIDEDVVRLNIAKTTYPKMQHNFKQANLAAIPFKTAAFDHVICSAVLHFASSYQEFDKMVSELVRVLKPEGTLFVRMTSNIGIENKVRPVSEGVCLLPDGTQRFLLTKSLVQALIDNHDLSFLEPLKTVNVNDMRCMSTLVLQKN